MATRMHTGQHAVHWAAMQNGHNCLKDSHLMPPECRWLVVISRVSGTNLRCLLFSLSPLLLRTFPLSPFCVTVCI